MKQISLAVVLMILLMALPRPASGVGNGGCTARLGPFETYFDRISTFEGERLEGNVTSHRQPIYLYIYQDKGYDDISALQPKNAIYNSLGMISRFDLVSDTDTNWLLVFINSNNLTQDIEYHWVIHDSLSNVVIRSAIRTMPMTALLVLTLFGAVIFHRRKTHNTIGPYADECIPDR